MHSLPAFPVNINGKTDFSVSKLRHETLYGIITAVMSASTAAAKNLLHAIELEAHHFGPAWTWLDSATEKSEIGRKMRGICAYILYLEQEGQANHATLWTEIRNNWPNLPKESTLLDVMTYVDLNCSHQLYGFFFILLDFTQEYYSECTLIQQAGYSTAYEEQEEEESWYIVGALAAYTLFIYQNKQEENDLLWYAITSCLNSYNKEVTQKGKAYNLERLRQKKASFLTFTNEQLKQAAKEIAQAEGNGLQAFFHDNDEKGLFELHYTTHAIGAYTLPLIVVSSSHISLLNKKGDILLTSEKRYSFHFLQELAERTEIPNTPLYVKLAHQLITKATEIAEKTWEKEAAS